MDPNTTDISGEFEVITESSIKRADDDDFLLSNNLINNQRLFPISFQLAGLPNSSSLSFTAPLKSFANSLYYNYLPSTTSTKLNPFLLKSFESALPLYLFNTKFSEDETLPNGFICHNDVNKLHASFLNELSTLILFTYRTNIHTANNVFDSDCGWGCTIRVCQMMLAKGILNCKIHQHKMSHNSTITQEHVTSLIRETLLLFYDNDIPVHCCEGTNEYKHVLSLVRGSGATAVTPVFSIKRICAVTNCYKRYTSSQLVIDALAKISEQYLQSSLKIIQVESTDISQQYLHSTFFDVNSHTCHMGIVFITFRFSFFVDQRKAQQTTGAYIRGIFERMRNTIGFVSGSSNRAYYFIGVSGDGKDLVYVDPHFTQKAAALPAVAGGDISSYVVRSLYRISPKQISSFIQLGILIKNENDYKTLISNLEELSKCWEFICLK